MTHSKTSRVLFGVLAGLLVGAISPRAEIIEQILVKVNGEILTKTELEARQVAALKQMGQQVDPKADLSDAQIRKMLDEVTPQLLVGIVDELLVVQRGHELGYKMGEEQFQGILDSIKKDNKLETDEQFQAALKQEGMTMAELRKNLERQAIFTRVQQNEVVGRLAVSDEEARRYYDAHKSEFTSPQAITLREIFVAVPSDPAPTVAQDTAAREKATQLRQRVLAGESFEKLAADLSDSPSRANAGLIGPLSLSEVSAELKKLLEGMKVGEVTDLLRSNRGYQIIKFESSSVPETVPFAKAREDISNRVFTSKRQDEFQKYLEKLRAQAIIEWKNPDVKKAYDQGVQMAKTNAAPPPS